MSKINLRSPYYLDISEPIKPLIELTCDLIALNGLGIDEFGNVTLPVPKYGDVLFYTSTDVDFSNGKFDTVITETVRNITFTISIPSDFSNASNNSIDCTASAIQPAYVCTGGITLNGSIPNQLLNTNQSITIDVSSYFTQGVLPIAGYNITNSYPNYFTASISGSNLTISSLYKGGTKTFFVEAQDTDFLTCNATQPIQVEIISLLPYTCIDSYLKGGSVKQDGTIIEPDANGLISAIKLTSGGSPITSVPANNTGSPISYTLYFDISIPDGYSNTGSTIECAKTFIQDSSVLPEFNCETANLTAQAIYTSGAILEGNIQVGTITSFNPKSFETVSVSTPRDVEFNVLAPDGYSNSGIVIPCVKTLTQPPILQTGCGNDVYYVADTFTNTFTQLEAIYQDTNYKIYLNGFKVFAQTPDFASLVSNNLCWEFSGNKREYNATQNGAFNYFLIRKSPFYLTGSLKTAVKSEYDYYVGIKGSIIYEVWLYNYYNNSFYKIS